MSRDTYKQRWLSHQLAQHGHPDGWREYLLARHGEGVSAARIAMRLARAIGVEIDDTTLSGWIKQALREQEREKERAPPDGSPPLTTK